MIWYLLYPLRGTTEPPALASSHPLRNAFTRYGRYVAGHVITALLISAAVGTILIYPIPFLFTRDSMNGASILPHHVWTAAQPLAYDASTEPDIIMRSVWVHSNYMEALKPEILSAALEIQDELLGPMSGRGQSGVASEGSRRQTGASYPIDEREAAHIKNGLTKRSWLFHSPLIYWNCSQDKILADSDVLATVNEKKNMTTAANITLRHSIVFSGKRFEDRRLVAADAIVITLLYLRDSPVGREWESRALSIPQRFQQAWDVYPPDGNASKSELYEFQFRPMSVRDVLGLGLAYGLAVMYFLMSLSKLRAVKSKFGLIVTVVTQIAFSIMSSFTVCAVFNFDLSRIPHAAYPLVVLSMSLENIFRLINAAILSPSEENTSNRIGYAFGQTAHIALASSMQNVALLVGLSRMVSPGVSAFCIFAAVAIVFDLFYLSTFFLSVLSVDVRRMELGDALAKAAMRHSRRGHLVASRASWIDRVLQGKIAMSTRIAGSVITIGFVIIAQWHFFGDDNVLRKVLRLYNGPTAARSLVKSEALLLKGLHQARSPTSWLKNQDHETAREVINAVKPAAYSYVARVFEPLIFVKKNSDRMPHTKEPTLLPAVYDFINHERIRFVVIVVIVLAALRLLMNFLLWEDDTEFGNNADNDDTPTLSINTMKDGHTLDIAKLFPLGDRRIISVGLDRVVRLWDLAEPRYSYDVANGNDTDQCPFPIFAVASDSKSEWIALLLRAKVSFWNVADRCWGESVALESSYECPVAFFFDEATDRLAPTVVVVYKDGTVVEMTSAGGIDNRVTAACTESLLSAHVITQSGEEESAVRSAVVAVTTSGKIIIARREDYTWRTRVIQLPSECEARLLQIVGLAPSSLVAIGAVDRVHLVDAESGEVIRTLCTERMQPNSLHVDFIRHGTPAIEVFGLSLLTVCYLEARTKDCIMHVYTPADDCEAFYLKVPSGDREDAKNFCTVPKESKKRISVPGAWAILADGSILGMRENKGDRSKAPDCGNAGLRQRFASKPAHSSSFTDWEVWASSVSTEVAVDKWRPLFEKKGDEAGHILINKVGPRVRVGVRSVAFAFGNIIKLVSLGGPERFEEDESNAYENMVNKSIRRKRQNMTAKARLPS